ITPAGFPHSDISGSKSARVSPKLFAACHVLHRLLAPRHPPSALCSLTTTATHQAVCCHAWPGIHLAYNSTKLKILQSAEHVQLLRFGLSASTGLAVPSPAIRWSVRAN